MSEVPQDAPEPSPWIRWPVWVVAVVLVLPFRLLWELLRLVGRFLLRYVGRPLARLWERAVVVPVVLFWHYVVVRLFRRLGEGLGAGGRFLARYVGRPLAWFWHHAIAIPVALAVRYLVIVPLAWLWPRVVVAPLAWLWPRLVVAPVTGLGRLIRTTGQWFARVSAPLWRLLGRGLLLLVRGIVWLLEGFARWVLVPGWRGAGWIAALVYEWLLRPVGRAVVRVWRRTVVPCWRTAAAGGRWLRDSVWRPSAVAAGNVLSAFGLNRRV